MIILGRGVAVVPMNRMHTYAAKFIVEDGRTFEMQWGYGDAKDPNKKGPEVEEVALLQIGGDGEYALSTKSDMLLGRNYNFFLTRAGRLDGQFYVNFIPWEVAIKPTELFSPDFSLDEMEIAAKIMDGLK